MRKVKAIFHQPWRGGWLGRLLNRHSIVEEFYGRCWCQKIFDGYPYLQGAAYRITPDFVIKTDSDDYPTRVITTIKKEK